jgi:predicted Zn-dependent protease
MGAATAAADASPWSMHVRTAALAAASLCVWVSTPASHWLTAALLWLVPVEVDVWLGHNVIAPVLEDEYPPMHDPHYTPLLRSIGHHLVQIHRHSPPTQQHRVWNVLAAMRSFWGVPYDNDPFQWDFAVVQSSTINAFALPGGIVRVTSELLRTVHPTRDELAALIGHEMGHILYRHSMGKIVRKLVLGDVLVNVVGTNSGPRQQEQAESSPSIALGNMLLRSAQRLGELKISRKDEYQADAVAWDLLLASASYSPQSVHSLLSKLEHQEQLRRPGAAGEASIATAKSSSTTGTPDTPSPPGIAGAIEAWTSTHPATSDRLRAVEKKWASLPAIERKSLQDRSDRGFVRREWEEWVVTNDISVLKFTGEEMTLHGNIAH